MREKCDSLPLKRESTLTHPSDARVRSAHRALP